MGKTIKVTLDPKSIDKAIRELMQYEDWLRAKCDELAVRLAQRGAVNVSLGYASTPYTGAKDVSVKVEDYEDGRAAIVASGHTVLFLEFGAGVTYGYGHPQAGEFGYGPTTYPGQKHAADPKGWWFRDKDGLHHTYGNAPGAVMYLTAQELRDRVEEVAREVFSHD